MMKMARRRFPIKIISTVILVGLLIFFHNSTPIRSLRSRIVVGITPIMRSIIGIRWSVGGWGVPGGVDAIMAKRTMEENFMQAEASMQSLQKENDRLRTILGFKERNKINLKGSSVFFYGRDLGNEFLLIDRGTKDGITIGQLAINAAGILVGRVSDAQESFAKVSIATNPNEVYEAELSPHTIKTFAKGIGGGVFSLELLPHNAVIRIGDFVIVKNERGMFPAGIVQRISSTMVSAFKEAFAVTLAQPDSLREVFVVIQP